MQLRLNRILSYPTVRVLSRDGDVTRLKIDGLVCDEVCAVRSKQALRSVRGVTSVSVDYDAGTADVAGEPQQLSAYQAAIDGVVAGKPLRRWLERIARLRGGRERVSA